MSRRIRNEQHQEDKTVSTSNPTVEGAGVHLKRAFGYDPIPQFDPFLCWMTFARMIRPSIFPVSPGTHTGESKPSITYVLTEDVEHGDSMGNTSDTRFGDVP